MRRSILDVLLLAAIISIGFSITANAAKPTPRQLIYSAALKGGAFTCIINNLTGSHLTITVESIRYDGTSASPTHWGVDPWRALHQDWAGANIDDMYYCAVSWLGEPDDVKATFCRYDDVYPNGMTCLEVK